ncbi:abi-like protein [Paraglaciecola mesophila KMM 241]|uniref:Abi-like protein n=1 Tax=Paraglaciecola mesophila KMM 241 TaxID=1128912 RepID=K6XUG2_9ALTE|nr:Abi family protein [Paraglaciecola mesophila]GAC24254.1 abi-like protein [Paraglaciecola mesophila KMM 241]
MQSPHPQKIPYQKPYKSSADLCVMLQNQGLAIGDIPIAKETLDNCSYYRFKAYLFPLKNHATKQYNPNTTFEDGLELYEFDNELRFYLFKLIAKVEVGVRSVLDQWITKETNNSFWYLDSSLFKDNGTQIKTVNQVRGMFVDSKEEFAKHYSAKYYNDYCPFHRDLPPGWVALELMTFGNVLSLMNSFSDTSIQSLKLNRFAKKKLNVEKFTTLCNWMEAIRQVRNACGHHNRLFNRNLAAPNGIKKYLQSAIQLVKTRQNQSRVQDQLNRLYTNMAAIQVLLEALGHEEKIGNKINTLFSMYPKAWYDLPPVS